MVSQDEIGMRRRALQRGTSEERFVAFGRTFGRFTQTFVRWRESFARFTESFVGLGEKFVRFTESFVTFTNMFRGILPKIFLPRISS